MALPRIRGSDSSMAMLTSNSPTDAATIAGRRPRKRTTPSNARPGETGFGEVAGFSADIEMSVPRGSPGATAGEGRSGTRRGKPMLTRERATKFGYFRRIVPVDLKCPGGEPMQ
jgi:hypothetical protein